MILKIIPYFWSMILYQKFNLSLPLESPVLIFSLILFIILFAPLILNKFKIPHLIGLIIAGAIIGPNGFNLMLRDSSIILFGTVGLLYIMFLAGLEIDMSEFKKNSSKSLIFGLYTFFTPMTLGVLSSYYILDFTLISSVLLASMYASHTLIAYPIISKLGVAKNRAVNVTIGGTVITDTAALLVLAAIAGLSTGVTDDFFWWRLGISVIIAGLVITALLSSYLWKSAIQAAAIQRGQTELLAEVAVRKKAEAAAEAANRAKSEFLASMSH